MGAQRYDFTGGWQRFTVPKGVEYISVEMAGAGSGARQGGFVTGRIQVQQGQDLWIMVGEAGNIHTGSKGGKAAFGGGGAGGNGVGQDGGNGGGGATAIRANSQTGTVKAVAGGAGGASGDVRALGEDGTPHGQGGLGGGMIGGAGSPGGAGDGAVGNATGGTQSQGGNKGTSSAGMKYDGESAGNQVLASGGKGGSRDLTDTFGGGGGGGGYRSGGGGQAGRLGFVPAGGGGGGSNYVGGLIGYVEKQGEGGVGHGYVELSWADPAPKNQPAHAPTDVQIDGKPAEDGHITGSMDAVTISARIDDPDAPVDSEGNPIPQRVRMVAQISDQSDFSSGVVTMASDWVDQEKRASVRLTGLIEATRYYVRLYTRDEYGLLSQNYTSANFWTNRYPLAPEQLGPSENATIPELGSVEFKWKPIDPDESDQAKAQVQWRRARTTTLPPGEWTTHTIDSWQSVFVANPDRFKANTAYGWRVRTRDPQGLWGPWSRIRTFYTSGTSTPPIPLEPSRNEAVDASKPAVFKWKFRDRLESNTQKKADIQYRPVGADVWTLYPGTTLTPGADRSWTLPANLFMPGFRYEWQVRTETAVNSVMSEWSESGYFWAVATPGVATTRVVVPDSTTIEGVLGSGEHRVFVYDRGGLIPRGELHPLSLIRWNRVRDDISSAIVATNGFDESMMQLLGTIRSWMHELVIFRNGVRVFEGPITRITYGQDSVEFEAKDVMAYVYRRIMRQGYNDSYRVTNNEQLGLRSVVERATRIIMNALAPDDPNVLPYLTTVNYPDDARQSRNVPDFSRTAWEEVDDLAATGGLDYATVGRRIMLWDTHRQLGRLPEMRDEHFSDPPVVTEYGMQLATAFGVTNNNGIYGLAERPDTPYGVVEQLASAYGESEGDGGLEETLTDEARERLEDVLREQARRNIAPRWPTPLVVRVPDNSSLHPETPVTINQLIPGVWIPLRSRGTVRDVAQWQKLDLVTVEQTAEGENITVTMSPAPGLAGFDPDADNAAAEE